MKKIVGIIQARMNSSRLPGKVLMPVMGKPLLQYMLERLRGSYTLSDIVVATTQTSPQIVDLCDQMGVGWYIGPEDDVLTRVLECAKFYEADVIVELTGDCPLIDPAMVDKVVSEYLMGGCDFAWNHTPHGAPRGMDVRVFSTELLEEISELTDDPADREHVSLYIWEHPYKFIISEVDTVKRHWYRLTVDTPEDYEVVKSILYVFRNKPDFTLFDIVSLLDRRADLANLNAHVEQKAVR